MRQNILLLLIIISPQNKILNAKIKEKELVDKSDISNLVKIFDLNTKIVAIALKAELKADKDKTVKLQAFDSSYFYIKIPLEDNDSQSHSVF